MVKTLRLGSDSKVQGSNIGPGDIWRRNSCEKSPVAGEVVDVVASLAGGFAPLRVDVACGPIKNFSYVDSMLFRP